MSKMNRIAAFISDWLVENFYHPFPNFHRSQDLQHRLGIGSVALHEELHKMRQHFIEHPEEFMRLCCKRYCAEQWPRSITHVRDVLNSWRKVAASGNIDVYHSDTRDHAISQAWKLREWVCSHYQWPFATSLDARQLGMICDLGDHELLHRLECLRLDYVLDPESFLQDLQLYFPEISFQLADVRRTTASWMLGRSANSSPTVTSLPPAAAICDSSPSQSNKRIRTDMEETAASVLASLSQQHNDKVQTKKQYMITTPPAPYDVALVRAWCNSINQLLPGSANSTSSRESFSTDSSVMRASSDATTSSAELKAEQQR